ncbi:MAG: hypothetical protein Q3Y08_03080 [Butyricicoccus sp.]|nr:hypothetical protein [Butyricicoccus sp.]
MEKPHFDAKVAANNAATQTDFARSISRTSRQWVLKNGLWRNERIAGFHRNIFVQFSKLPMVL